MASKSTNEIAQQWFNAFNAHNLEQLLALYSETAQHYSPKLKIRQPETRGLISGKTALRAWWADSFERLPSLRYTPTCFIANHERIFMEYLRQADGEEDITVGEVLEVQDGLIVASRVYHS